MSTLLLLLTVVAGAASSDCSIEGVLLSSSSDDSLSGGGLLNCSAAVSLGMLYWLAGSGVVVLNSCSATMCELRVFLWCIGLLDCIGHPQPHQLNWARVYCGCQPGHTRVALHPGKMMEEPERQPHVHWTTCYDYRGDVDYRRVFLHPYSTCS